MMIEKTKEQDKKVSEARQVPDTYQVLALVTAMAATVLQHEELGWVAVWLVFASFATLKKTTADYRQLLSSALLSLFAVFQARRIRAE